MSLHTMSMLVIDTSLVFFSSVTLSSSSLMGSSLVARFCSSAMQSEDRMLGERDRPDVGVDKLSEDVR